MDKRFWRAAGVGIGAAGGMYWYAHRHERARVSLERFTLPVPARGIPPAGLTILHLSDFHFRGADPVQETRLARLTALLAGEPYDVLAFTGDLIHDMVGLPRALEFLATLRPSFGSFAVPGNRDYWGSEFKALLGTSEERAGLSLVGLARLIAKKSGRMFRAFAGNERSASRVRRHDVERLLAALDTLGIQPLVNRSVRLNAPDADIWFAGVDDLNNGRADLPAALLGVPSGAPLVLLSHNPDVWQDSVAHRASLILSGHTHGGQIRLPLLGAWYRQGTHLTRAQAAGWFREGECAMYVTRGLGESFPYRFRAPPQAALIRLVRDENKEAA